MRKLILLRGPSAVGKTTIARSLIAEIKDGRKESCAYICEDNFRKQMQCKYKAAEKIVHLNAVPLILSVIDTLEKRDKKSLSLQQNKES